jgi:glycosyltransferase involved in cell wall biosynthesis
MHPRLADVVVLSTADWDNPFWTNKQHVTVELARLRHRVLYVDSIGLRRPTLSKQDLLRICRRLLKALRPPRRVRPNIWVWSPIAIPLQDKAWARYLNRLFLSAGLLFWTRILRIRRDILWTYNPMTTRLFPTAVFGRLLYHCVDEIMAQPGMPQQQIGQAESELVKAADVCFVTSHDLLAKRRLLNVNTHYLPNVADYRHFSAAQSDDTEIPSDIRQLPQPVIGFVGAISGYKLDFALIRRLAESHPEWSVVMIGQVGEGEPETDAAILHGQPNIYLLGPRAYEALPAYLKGFAVAILPSALNDYTRAMFPMKFFEYLAAGRPVVATNLHALQDFRNVAALAENPDDFVRAISDVLKGQCPSLASRLDVAKQQTYEVRTAKMLQILDQGTV